MRESKFKWKRGIENKQNIEIQANRHECVSDVCGCVCFGLDYTWVLSSAHIGLSGKCISMLQMSCLLPDSPLFLLSPSHPTDWNSNMCIVHCNNNHLQWIDTNRTTSVVVCTLFVVTNSHSTTMSTTTTWSEQHSNHIQMHSVGFVLQRDSLVWQK